MGFHTVKSVMEKLPSLLFCEKKSDKIVLGLGGWGKINWAKRRPTFPASLSGSTSRVQLEKYERKGICCFAVRQREHYTLSEVHSIHSDLSIHTFTIVVCAQKMSTVFWKKVKNQLFRQTTMKQRRTRIIRVLPKCLHRVHEQNSV